MAPTPPGKSTAPKTPSGTDAAAAKVISLLQSLHLKVDALPKCECNALRQEITELKKLIGKSVEPPPSPPIDTYSVVKRALNDAATFADKAKRAVWVGREERSNPSETIASDQKALEELCLELNDNSINQALAEGKISHRRHPDVKGDRKKRIIKIAFPDQKLRDHFLFLSRSTRPTTVSKNAGNFLRRDLCPYELELERKARIDAYTMNCKIGGLAYGVRDEKLVKFNGNPRSLPPGYESRHPRGFSTYESSNHTSLPLGTSTNNTSHHAQSNANTSLNTSSANSDILAPLATNGQRKPTASATTNVNGTGIQA